MKKLGYFNMFSIIICVYITLSSGYLIKNIKTHSRLRLSSIKTIASVNETFIRSLGSYEKLLGRTSQFDQSLIISHGCCVCFNGYIEKTVLKEALLCCIKKHPMLRATIIDDQWHYCSKSINEILNTVFRSKCVVADVFDENWQFYLEETFNKLTFEPFGPLWSVIQLIASDYSKSALVFSFNHALDDQQSLNIILKDILDYINEPGSEPYELKFPPSIETAVGFNALPSPNTILWSLYQLSNSIQSPVVVPFNILHQMKTDMIFRNYVMNPVKRATISTKLSLSPIITKRIITKCKEKNCTVTQFLSAVMLYLTSSLVNQGSDGDVSTKLRFLLSVGLRKFKALEFKSENPLDWTNGTVSSASGAIDFVIDVPSTRLADNQQLWELVQACKEKSNYAINEKNFVPESVKLFDFGMKTVDIFQAVEIEANNPSTLGRGYSCSVSNVGNVEFHESSSKLLVTGIYFGTSQSQSGVLAQLSCMTVNGTFCGCLQFPYPIITRDLAKTLTSNLETFLSNV